MENNKLPVHVGVIMDGNGRWAKKRLMPRSVGHKSGMDRMIALAEHAKKSGIKYLTVYVMSTENLARRSADEIEGLFGLIRKYFTVNVKRLFEQGSGIKIIGDISALPQDVVKILTDAENLSPKNPDFTLVFAINYGGRCEIVNAVNKAVEKGEKITVEQFGKLLYTDGVPDPDLIIRTGGEMRLSNFLTYQSAYSELYFTDALFPDFSDAEFDRALASFAARERRFGGAQ
ncbi:MAG: di-trans,poly-cis-decaprenylcistransferase [Clostridia bacterium]|nr:di-trans,poly-cis-decaprenylcistransferase [Clostridia bacterium]